MSVTQTLMGPGSFEVSWRDILPRSIRNKIQPHDYLCIGPRGLLDLGLDDAGLRAALKASRGYSGIILEINSFGLSGQDLTWRLGAGSENGPLVLSPIVRGTSTNTSTWLDQILPCDGIAKGTVTNGTSFAGITSGFVSKFEVLNWICEQADVEWILQPDGTIDVAPTTTLFPNPSTTAASIITRNPSGDEGGLSGVNATSLDLSRDGSSVVSQVLVQHSGPAAGLNYSTATQTPTGVRWKDWLGAAPENRTVVAQGLSLRAARASTVASNIVGRLAVDQKMASLTSRTHNVTDEVLPGDRVWVYDLDSGLYDSGNQVTWRGDVIQPIRMRVAGVTWPIAAARGVYARTDGGGEWIDLTSYIEVEDGDVQWDVTIAGRKVNRSPVSSGVVKITMPGESGGGKKSRVTETGLTETADMVGGWTPSITNWSTGTGGNAGIDGTYSVSGGVMMLEVSTRVGTTGAGRGASGNPLIALPTGWQLRFPSNSTVVQYGDLRIQANGAFGEYQGIIEGVVTNPERIRLRYLDAAARPASMSATLPAAWIADDGFSVCVAIPVEPV